MSDELAQAAAALFAGLEPGLVLQVAVFDAALLCRAISPSLLGPADAVGRPAIEVLPPGIAPALVEALVEVRDGPAEARRFERLAPPDGGGPVYRVGCYRLAGAGEPLLGVLAADITERVRAQRRVRQTRERLDMAERLAGLGAFTWWPEPDNRWRWSEPLIQLAGVPGIARTPPYAAWVELIEPEDRARVAAAIDEGLAGTPTDVSVRQRMPDGSERVMRILSVPTTVDGKTVRVDGVVQDVTAAARTAAQQRVVAELGRAALERLDVDELMERATGAVAATLGLEGVTIAATVPDGAVAAPIPGPDEPWGVLAVAAGQRSLGEEEQTFLRAVANVLGAAIEGRRLESELGRQADARGRLLAAALDAEDRTRREISETLHDGPLQDLLVLNQFVARLEPEDARTALHLDRAQAGLRQAITGLREVMLELHPVVLDVGGLDSALAAVAAQQGRLGGFRAEVRIEPDAGGVRDELVLSIARELLVNAAKHSHATEVVVTVRRFGADLVLEVADDGVGIPEGRLGAALLDGHIGLASSRQRVESEGGHLDVVTGAGTGTRVTAVFPVA